MRETISLKEYLDLCNKSGIEKKSDFRTKKIDGIDPFRALSINGQDGKPIGTRTGAQGIYRDFVALMIKKYPDSMFEGAGIPITYGKREDQNKKSFLIDGTEDKWILPDFKVNELIFRCATFVKKAEPMSLDKYHVVIDTESEEVVTYDWFPHIDEYDPGISKERWVDLLNDVDIVGPVWGKWLAMFYSFPEGASCSMVADKFNDNAYSIKGIGMNFARKIAEVTACPVMEEDGVKRYWRIPFVGRGTSEGELGTWVYKLRPEIYEALTEVDIMRYLNSASSSEEKMKPKELLEHITSYINSRGFHYSDEVIKNFYLSLRAKPFVILAGVSGTGKSKIAQLFAEAISADFVMIPVRPDWSDSSDLLGYVDLNGKFRAGKLTEALKSANSESDRPFFICLDEMNLARVEYYFADMLSLMETDKGKVFEESDFRGDVDAFSKYGDVHISDNVYFIGTVNMDETTFPFSRKVLDRANTIEFSEIDFKAGLGAVYGDVEKIKVSNSLLCGEYRSFKKAYADAKDDIDDMIAILEEVNGALEAIGAQVAYRVRDEIASYIATGTSAELLEFTDLMDLCLMQKILPRIQGSSDAVEAALEGVKSIADREGYDRSSKKLQFMIDRKKNDGYTSYWL